MSKRDRRRFTVTVIAAVLLILALGFTTGVALGRTIAFVPEAETAHEEHLFEVTTWPQPTDIIVEA